jgi:transposase
MGQKSGPVKEPAEQLVKEIRRATRRQFSAEEKIRIVLSGLRGEDSIAELCRREGIVQNLYYRWSKEFLEAGKKRLAGDTARAATSDEVRDLRREASALKEVVAELMLENRLLKKRMARPVRKKLVRDDLTGLRQRIRSRSCRPGQDGGPRALVLISTAAPVRHFFDQASRASVQPSGHLAITTRRLQRPPTPDGCLVADLRYVVAGWSPIVGL